MDRLISLGICAPRSPGADGGAGVEDETSLVREKSLKGIADSRWVRYAYYDK